VQLRHHLEPEAHPIFRLSDPSRHERRLVTLLARLKPSEPDFHDFHVPPNINRRKRFSIKPNDEWLKRGQELFERERGDDPDVQLWDSCAPACESAERADADNAVTSSLIQWKGRLRIPVARLGQLGRMRGKRCGRPCVSAESLANRLFVFLIKRRAM
jgi:hypothetical protein